MHEGSIAREIFETVQKIAHEKKGDIKKISLEIGELTLINPEQLIFWLNIFFEKEIQVEIKVVEGKIECADCGFKGSIQNVFDEVFHFSIPVLSCRECGGNNVKILEGKDLRIRNVELEIEENEQERKN